MSEDSLKNSIGEKAKVEKGTLPFVLKHIDDFLAIDA